MSPKKRKPSSPSGASPPSAKKASRSTVTPPEMLEAATSPEHQAKLQPGTIVSKIMGFFAEHVKGKGLTPCEVLETAYPTPKDKLEFAQAVDSAFKAEEGIKYSKDLTPGPKRLRPWQLNWSIMSGNKGFVQTEYQEALLELVLTQGCLTIAVDLCVHYMYSLHVKACQCSCSLHVFSA